ncbi:DUF4976 domain-containing protein [Prolixibacteraceae bacterium JC049]|nr:DUF4976 domain-containing protein [Prolixibacteraceae bacterium JC049]
MKNKILLPAFMIGAVMMGCNASDQKKTKQPNIIYIMSDDHAYQAISAYGGKINHTPNIDRLADEGVVFTNSFVTNSICAPSRAVMLTGKFSHLNGQTDNVRKFDGTQQTYPKLLQKAGYQTALVGKWHLKSDPTGFDFWSVHYDQGDYYNPDFKEMGKRKHYTGYSTNIVCDNSIKWLEKRDLNKPFALLVHFKAPHRNWMPDTAKLTMYEDVEFELPNNFFDNFKQRGSAAKEQEMSIYEDMQMEWDLKMDGIGKSGVAGKLSTKLARMNPDERAKWDKFYAAVQADLKEKNPKGKELANWKFQRYMRDYLKVVSSVDDNVGRLLDYLDKNGLAENTIVVYTSDQGFYLGEHGWFDKRFMYEESLRTPLLMRYPEKIQAGAKKSALVQNIDYAPTFLDWAGVKIPDDMQGESLTPLFNGVNDVRDHIYYHYFEYPGPHAVKRHYGVRSKQYKLIHFYNDVNEWEFYDLEKDPNEMYNQIENPVYWNEINEMKAELKSLRKKYGDNDEVAQQILKEDQKRLNRRKKRNSSPQK